jgi:DNA adenine methylase Dam
MSYIETPFNYTGGKFKLLPQILPEMDESKSIFLDVFTGGGSVYTNILDKYNKVIVNDIISDLIGIHKELLESDVILNKTKLLCPSKEDHELFLKLREEYNINPSPEGLWALMLSSTNNMIRFNQKFKYNQTFGKRSWNDNTQKKVNRFTDHIRKYKNNLQYISVPFEQIEINSDMMIYCDPPYSNTSAGYNAYWKKDDDEKLYKYIKNIDKVGASFMLSGVLEHDGSPCKLLERLIIDGYKVIELDFNYNKVSRKGEKETKEIIIKNY